MHQVTHAFICELCGPACFTCMKNGYEINYGKLVSEMLIRLGNTEVMIYHAQPVCRK